MQWLQEHVHQNDLNFLWQAVVQQNHVLRFALQKLALPVEAHNGHSSQFLRKSLGVLVSGAGLGASLLLPTGGYQNLGIATGSQALQNIIQGRNKPMSDLSPTEHIQLATLVDELKFQLISQYETYTQALGQWQQAQHQLQSQTVLYHGVKGQGGLVAMSAASGFYRAVAEEQRHKQQAQLARLQLERLAGTEAVAELKLTPAVALLLHPPVSPPAASPLSPSSSPLQDEPLQSSGSLLVAPPAPHRKGQTVQRWAVGQQAKALKKSPLPTTAKQMPLPQLRYERDEWL
jgi:hypothetical protein